MGEKFEHKYKLGGEFKKKNYANGDLYSQHRHAVSLSNDPLIYVLKHFFVKDLRLRKGSGFHDFSDSLTDSYLSRILHKIIPHASKGKIAGMNLYVSRSYPLDSYLGSTRYIDKMTVDDLFKNRHPSLWPSPDNPNPDNKVRKLDGLLKSIVFNIITENWDAKLDNISAYRAGNNYNVAAFDLDFALNNNAKYKKIWTKQEIESLFMGTGTESGQISVAEALIETISDVGSRTTGYYIDQKETNPKSPKFAQSMHKLSEFNKNKLVIWLGRELSEINPNHSLALIRVFKEVLSAIETHEPAAYEKTIIDTSGKLPKLNNDLHKIMENNKDRLYANLAKFKGFVKEIESEILPAKRINWVEKTRPAEQGKSRYGQEFLSSPISSGNITL